MLGNFLNLLAPWSLPLLLAGLVAALAFGRSRSAWLLALALLPVAAGALQADAGYATLWLPGLLLLTAGLREPGLLSWKAAALAGLAALGWVQAQGDGGLLLHGLARLRTLLEGGAPPLGYATLLTGLGAASCLLRWTLRGQAIELGNAAGLAVLAAALSQRALAQPEAARGLVALAALVFIGGVLWAAFRMAFVDPLTNLSNRRALDERLARSGWKLALAMVDVDFFKKLNDRYGHDSGDVVLRAVARELARTRGAHAYRYGGEEFCLVFSGRALARADAELEDLRTRIEAMRVRLGKGPTPGVRAQAVRKGSVNGEVRCTVSIGLAERAPERRTVESVLKAADQALYKAKQKGRNRVVAA